VDDKHLGHFCPSWVVGRGEHAKIIRRHEYYVLILSVSLPEASSIFLLPPNPIVFRCPVFASRR
jgi:hypothetical protein